MHFCDFQCTDSAVLSVCDRYRQWLDVTIEDGASAELIHAKLSSFNAEIKTPLLDGIAIIDDPLASIKK
jgi:hypothetical protein